MNESQRERTSNLRARMRTMLATMSDTQRHEAATAVCSRLTGLEAFCRAKVVMLYMPLASEVDLTPAALRCFQTGKTVCVPRLDWKHRDMAAVEVNSFDDDVMDTDEHGLRTPRGGFPLLPTLIDLLVVPGLAFDPHGHRLGRGDGFYDRFLTRLRRSATTVGLAFDAQVIDIVPAHDRDISVDIVVTDRRLAFHGNSRPRP
ncbi:MAG: 5-formyltetrahydrofolate cyclo-ligase [Planctomycetota bacterium]|jgi:5-formyltetrahydrofolate cyclo-ligase